MQNILLFNQEAIEEWDDIQGCSQTSPDGRAHFLKHITPIVSYIASYWHAGSYMRLFMGVLKVQSTTSCIYKVV